MCSEWDATGRVQPYAVTSKPFQVTPWDGLTVSAPQVAKDGRSVSVDVGPDFARPLAVQHRPTTYSSRDRSARDRSDLSYTLGRYDYRVRDGIDYPDTMKQHPMSSYLTGRAGGDATDLPGGTTELFCFRCTFEPWAETGAVDRVTITVVRKQGGVAARARRLRPEEPALGGPDRRWSHGDRVFVARGDVRDTFGERNGTPSAVTTSSVAAPAGLPRAG